jgi:uncharacterized iron-regulated protein
MKKLAIILIAIISVKAFAQSKPAYQLFNNKGEIADYSLMIEDIAKVDMVFFGEYHTDPIAHWLQKEVTKDIYNLRGNDLFLGAEMFESGNQLVIDEYLQGLYPIDKFKPEVSQLWKNFDTDYSALLDFAKDHKLRFIATNIPRRYASIIHKKGLNYIDSLSVDAKKLISPYLLENFDPEVRAYKEMADHMGGHVPKNMLNIQAAQASKDATMAYFSVKNFNEGNILIHFQGSYHSNNNQGIIWWINLLNPGYEIKSLTTVYQSEWDELGDEERSEIADYIIVVADGMTQTSR